MEIIISQSIIFFKFSTPVVLIQLTKSMKSGLTWKTEFEIHVNLGCHISLTEVKRGIYASANWAITGFDNDFFPVYPVLTHWGRVTHICVIKLTIIGSDNGLSPGQCQAIIWTNAGILLIEPLGTNFSEILIKIHIYSFKKMLSGKWRPFCLGLNVLIHYSRQNACCQNCTRLWKSLLKPSQDRCIALVSTNCTVMASGG